MVPDLCLLCVRTGWKPGVGVVALCPLQGAYLLREAWPDTDALTVLTSEDPFPSPLSQHHIDPGIDEDSHPKGHIEGHN